MTSKKEHPEQIPTEDNQEETVRALEKQEGVPGEQRDRAVSNLTLAADVGQVLKDLEFPIKTPPRIAAETAANIIALLVKFIAHVKFIRINNKSGTSI